MPLRSDRRAAYMRDYRARRAAPAEVSSAVAIAERPLVAPPPIVEPAPVPLPAAAPPVIRSAGELEHRLARQRALGRNWHSPFSDGLPDTNVLIASMSQEARDRILARINGRPL